MRALYLHGFGSSPASSKADYLSQRFGERGISLERPDFNDPDFSTLTISRMVAQVAERVDAAAPDRVVLIGSSLGAFVAVQTAVGQARSRQHAVDRLVLLAPALDFARGGDVQVGDRSLEDWKRTGVTNVFHYAYGRHLALRYDLYEDACGYDCLRASLSMPVLVFQGQRDTVVDPAVVETWARERPNVELHLLDDDHQLAASLPYIWRAIERFLVL
jgi:pimeloyl-ACP methyl ester carboxylesterase